MKTFYKPNNLSYIAIENDCFYFINRYHLLRYPKQFQFMEDKTNHPHKIKTILFLQYLLNKKYDGFC